MLRFGVVGGGYMGRTYVHCLKHEVKGASVVAVTGGTRSAGLAVEFEIDWEPDLAALLARPDIDGVVLASPTQWHREQAVASAQAGKHVLVEKPMAATLPECDAMIDACARFQVALSVVKPRRYRRGAPDAKRLVDGGVIGDVRMIRATYTYVVGDYAGGKSWLLDPAAGSPFLDEGAHTNDMLRWFTGSDAVSAFAHYASYSGSEPPNQSAMVEYVFASGAMAQVWATYEVPAPGIPGSGLGTYLIVGSRGIIECEYYGVTRLGLGDQWSTIFDYPPVDFINDPLDPNRTNAFTAVLQDFVDAVAAGRVPTVSAADGRAAIEMGVAADRSAASGEVVRLPIPREAAT